jgi:hypothetical protein
MTTTYYILPEGVDPDAVNTLLSEIEQFVYKNYPESVDNIGSAHKIDESFVIEHADGFPEMRKVGTDGLIKKYTGRHYISVYGHIPFWAHDAIADLTKSMRIDEKEKKSRSDWQ